MAVKAAGNVTVTYNSNALTAYLNTTSLNAVVNQIDTSDFSSGAGTESIPGMADWTIPIGGHWDSTLDGYLAPDAVSPPTTLRTTAVAVTDSGSTTITYTWTTNTYVTNYTIDASSPSEGITWSAELKGSGAPARS